MIETIAKIGKWRYNKLPVERKFYGRFLKPPKLNEKKEYHYIVELVFDLDNKTIEPNILREYGQDDDLNLMMLAIKGGNNKSYYATVPKKNLNNLFKSLIGDAKSVETLEKGQPELLEIINDKGYKIKDQLFIEALEKIPDLKGSLIAKLMNGDQWKPDNILKEIQLPRNAEIVAITAAIKWNKLGTEPVLLAHMEGYKSFVKQHLNIHKEDNPSNAVDQHLCYVSNEFHPDVTELDLSDRYSINKMFVTTTKHYLVKFNDKNARNNYAVSQQIQNYLDYGSKFLLSNNQIKIAGINHIIIPSFLSSTEVDFDYIFKKFTKQSELLFDIVTYENFNTFILDEINDDIFWINYLAFESDGNSFKSINLIKDVSEPWLITLIKQLKEINEYFQKHYRTNQLYNFYTFFKFIPVKTDAPKNVALELFKDILEGRTVEREELFEFFTHYLRVQLSGNNKSYKNIFILEEFDWAIKDAVLVYYAFLTFLKSVNLINIPTMDEKMTNKQNLQEKEAQFFEKMQYDDQQKGLFYLGKLLNLIAYAQFKSNHKTKPVMNKLNYNGMDADDIRRLFLDLEEKIRQYSTKLSISTAEFLGAKFIENYNFNKADDMSPEENLFYILSGYAFRLINPDDKDTDENPGEENDKD